MRMLDISKDGKTREFSKDVDLSYLHIGGTHPITTPAHVTGTLVEERELYLLEYQVEYTSVLPCARCLTDVERNFSPSFSHLLGDTGEDPLMEDRIIPIQHGKIDLTQVVGSDVLLEMDEAPLCKPDCKGLCPVCGGDRNNKPCDCTVEQPTDPRFDVLRELLGK